MEKKFEKHTVSRWIAETELGRVTTWIRQISAVLRALGLPEASASYGDSRTLQVWRRDGGQSEPLLLPMGAEAKGAFRTNLMVVQVHVQVRALLPASAGAFSLSQAAFEKLHKTFRTFIDAPLSKAPQTVMFAVFFAHLDFVVRTRPELMVVKNLLQMAHAKEAIKSIAAGDVPFEDMVRGQSLVSQMRFHQSKMSVRARRFFLQEKMSVADPAGSDVVQALRLYAWATGQIFQVQFL